MKRITSLLCLMAIVALRITGAVPITFPGRDASSVGIYIEEINSGKVLASHNSNLALTPASILKCVTAATSLITLGKDFRYTTDFFLIGPSPENGEADMVIVGAGDPSMGGRDFEESASLPSLVADKLSTLGIGRLAGEVRISCDVLPEGGGVVPGWEVEDITESYGTGLFPVNWMDNYFESDYIIASPGEFFVEEMVGACANKGIGVEGAIYTDILDESPFAETDTTAEPTVATPSDTMLVYSHKSESLEKIMKVMMGKSVNLLAEGCLRATAPNAPADTAIAREKSLWKSLGVNLERTRILDGSGLARGNSISPRQIAGILNYMAKSPYSKTYSDVFPKAGKEGTVKTFLTKTRLAGRLAIKSGSMGGVHCYAGYLLGSNGQPTHSVVVMVNHFFCSRTQLKKSIERYLLNILP